MQQNTNRTKCENSKIQTRWNTKGQNTKGQNKIVTKYKCNKTQMEQNTNRTRCKKCKIQTQQNTTCQNTNVKKYKCSKIQT